MSATNIIPLDPNLQIELENFAREHGQTPAAALQDAVTAYLDLQGQDFEDDVAAIQVGYDAVQAGHTTSIEEFDRNMHRRYDISR